MIEKIFVRVTQEHINKGQPCNENLCPVALASGMRTGYTFLCDPKDFTVYRNPSDATKFIRDFDHGKPVKPFDFWAVLHKTVPKELR